MKTVMFLCLLVTGFLSARADDIMFANKTASFSNLQGQVYQNVQLVRGDSDGLIWISGASGGRICYTNLAPDLLESFGISSNRIGIAGARAQQKVITDARYRAAGFAEAQAKARRRAGLTNALPSVAGSNEAALVSGPAVAFAQDYPQGADYMNGAGYPYAVLYPLYPYSAGVPSAPSAPSAASGSLAPGAPHVRGVPPAPGAAVTSSAALAPPARGAHPAYVPPSPPRKGR